MRFLWRLICKVEGKFVFPLIRIFFKKTVVFHLLGIILYDIISKFCIGCELADCKTKHYLKHVRHKSEYKRGLRYVCLRLLSFQYFGHHKNANCAAVLAQSACIILEKCLVFWDQYLNITLNCLFIFLHKVDLWLSHERVLFTIELVLENFILLRFNLILRFGYSTPFKKTYRDTSRLKLKHF